MKVLNFRTFLKVFLPLVTAGALLLNACGIGDEVAEITDGKYDSIALSWDPSLAFPLGNDTIAMDERSGFDTTLFQTDPESGLPLWTGRVEVVMEGRIDFDLSSMEDDMENIRQVLVRLKVTNNFPDPVWAQAYFHDAGGRTLDSLFSAGPVYISPGNPGDNCSSEGSVSILDEMIAGDELSPLVETRELLLEARFYSNSVDNELVNCYPYYHLDLEGGAMLDLHLEY